MGKHQEALDLLKGNLSELAKATPDTMSSFMGLAGSVLKDGALSVREKELIVLGIAVAVRCSGCIQTHIEKLVGLGVTREELAEVIGVAILMGGGPSTVYGSEALAIADEFFGK